MLSEPPIMETTQLGTLQLWAATFALRALVSVCTSAPQHCHLLALSSLLCKISYRVVTYINLENILTRLRQQNHSEFKTTWDTL